MTSATREWSSLSAFAAGFPSRRQATSVARSRISLRPSRPARQPTSEPSESRRPGALMAAALAGGGGGRRGAASGGGGGRQGAAAARATTAEDRGGRRRRAASGNVGWGRTGGVDVWEWRWLLWWRRRGGESHTHRCYCCGMWVAWRRTAGGDV